MLWAEQVRGNSRRFVHIISGANLVGGELDETRAGDSRGSASASTERAAFPGRRAAGGDPADDPEGGRYGARFHAAERSMAAGEAERLPWQEKRDFGVLRSGVYRGLNEGTSGLSV